MFLRLMRFLFEYERNFERSRHDSFYGVKVDENSRFLYKSYYSNLLLGERFGDYMTFAFLGAFFYTGWGWYLLPFAA